MVNIAFDANDMKLSKRQGAVQGEEVGAVFPPAFLGEPKNVNKVNLPIMI